MPKTSNAEYNASSIDVNEGLDVVRAAPQIYVSNPDSHALFVIYKEPIDNGFDECNEGHGKDIFVAIDNDNYWCADQGRGIPVEIHPKTKISTLTTVFTTLSAGGKMRKEGSSYSSNTAGVHGMGVSISNALAESLQVWTWRSGECYTQKFSKGKPITKVTKTKWPKLPHLEKQPKKQGTVVCFTPDYTMFDAGSKLSTKQVRNFLDLSSYLRKGVRVHYADKKQRKTYYQPNGLIDYSTYIIEKAGLTKVGKPFILQQGLVDVVLQWTSGTEELTHSFVNKTPTKEGGTHTSGLTKAIVDAIKPFASKRAKYMPDDLKSGLVCVLNTEVSVPRFSTQIKDKLVTPEANALVYTAVKEELSKFFEKNKSLIKEITKRATEMYKLREEFDKNKKALAGLSSAKSRLKLPEKLSDCSSKDRSKCEIFFCEGESAAGSAILARNSEFQAVLELKGKILNAYTAKPDKLFTNKEVQDILVSLGYTTDPKKPLRYGKIVLLMDADEDGEHIQVLASSTLKKMIPRAFSENMVHTIEAALYNAQIGDKVYYAESIKELKEKIKNKKVPLNRVKGWGGIEKTKLEEIAFNPKTRNLTCITDITGKDHDDYLKLVGNDPLYRKKMLGIKVTNTVEENAE